MNVVPESTGSNPIASIVARVLAETLRDPDVIAAVQALAMILPRAESEQPKHLLNKRELAKALNVSTVTVDRMNVPHTFAGASRRYDLAEVRAELATRGRKASTPKRKAPEVDSIDVSAALARSGLRAIDGGAR